MAKAPLGAKFWRLKCVRQGLAFHPFMYSLLHVILATEKLMPRSFGVQTEKAIECKTEPAGGQGELTENESEGSRFGSLSTGQLKAELFAALEKMEGVAVKGNGSGYTG